MHASSLAPTNSLSLTPTRVARLPAPTTTVEPARKLRRKVCRPFRVPGMEAEALAQGLFWRTYMADVYCVEMVSKGAVRVRARGLKRGQRVQLWLRDPDASESVRLVGEVKSLVEDGSDWSGATVVLAAYSDRKGENTRVALSAMRELEARWAR